MVARLEEMDRFFAYQVDQPVLPGNASGPDARAKTLQRLRLPLSVERVPEDRLHQSQDPQSNTPIRLDPMDEIFAKLRLKDRGLHEGSSVVTAGWSPAVPW